MKDTAWVALNADSAVWAGKHAEEIEEAQTKHFNIWLRKPSFERLALFPDDGQ